MKDTAKRGQVRLGGELRMLKGGTGHQKEDYEGGTGDPFDEARTGDRVRDTAGVWGTTQAGDPGAGHFGGEFVRLRAENNEKGDRSPKGAGRLKGRGAC
jgi:hypothetical protein